jgi:cobalt-zinc-cadmium efflux system protein
MPHDHGPHGHHDHHHAHHHAPPDTGGRAFAIGTALNLGYVVVEAGFGLLAGSLAMLADAGHNLSDVLGLLLAWGAASLARRAPTRRRTYGWRRGSVLAALANGGLLLVATGAIAWEALRRLWTGAAAVETGTILWVAAIGVVVNFGTAALFLRGREHDLNMRGAYLHMMADGAVTVGVIVAAIVIRYTGWVWIDAATSLVIAAVILAGSWQLMRDSFDLALDAVPPGIDPLAVEAWLAAQPGVAEVHDLHIWALGTRETALTAHLVRPDAGLDDGFLDALRHGLAHRFGIGHATLQLEAGDPAHPCPQAPAEAL